MRTGSNEFGIGLRRLVIILVCLALTATAVAQSAVPAVTGNARVDKLLSQMTLEEKTTLIRGAREDPATDQGQQWCS